MDQTTGSVDDRFVRGGTMHTTAANNNPAELEAQIAQTRREMGETIDEIQQRLAPDRLKHEAQETVRQATIGKVEDMKDRATHTASNWRDDLVRTVRDNPVPAAMVGLGLGWLFMERSGNGRSHYGNGRSQPYSSEYMGSDYTRYQQYYEPSREPSTGERMRERGEEVRERAREAASELESRLQETTGELEQRAQETAEQVRQRAEQMQQQAEERYDEMRYRIQQETREARYGMQRMMNENPLAVGAVALALGLGVGLLMPSTRQEDELLGPYRDQIVDRAQNKAEETMEQVRSVASEAQSAAKEAMQDVKQETKQAAEEAKQQNITGMNNS